MLSIPRASKLHLMKEEEQIKKAAEVYGYVKEKDYTIRLQGLEEDRVFRICCKDMHIALTLYHSIHFRTTVQGVANLYIRSHEPVEKTDTYIEVIKK